MKMINNKHKPFTVILSRSYDITDEDLNVLYKKGFSLLKVS